MSPWLSDLFLRSQTDERLVALARVGHERALTAIVERYRRALLAYARRLDPDRAEDLVQQTFLSAMTALQAGAEVRHLRGWLYEILRNTRTRGFVPTAGLAELTDGIPSTESAQETAERRMLAVDALGAMAQLPARQHNALLQVAIHGRRGSDVADAMGMSEGALRQLVHRARSTVRTAVTAITPFPFIRWLSNPRSPAGAGLSEAALTAGTASTAGVAVKLSVGALVATGLVAGGVVSAVTVPADRGAHHGHPIVARLATDRTRAGAPAGGQADGGSGQSSGTLAGTGVPGGARASHRKVSGAGQASIHRREDRPAGRSGDGSPGGPEASGLRSGSGDGSGSGSTSGSGSGEQGGGSGSSPGGSSGGGDGGSRGGGGTGSGSDGGGGSSGSGAGSSSSGSDGGSGSSGSDGGSGSRGGTIASGSDSGSGGSDGGSSGSVSSGSSGSTGSGSDGGSGSGDGGQTSSGSTSSGQSDGG